MDDLDALVKQQQEFAENTHCLIIEVIRLVIIDDFATYGFDKDIN